MLAYKNGHKKKIKALSSLSTVLLLFPVVLLFFLGGLYVGTQFVHTSDGGAPLVRLDGGPHPAGAVARTGLRGEGQLIDQPPPNEHPRIRPVVEPKPGLLDNEVSAGHPRLIQPPEPEDLHAQKLPLPDVEISKPEVIEEMKPLVEPYFDFNAIYENVVKGFEYSLHSRSGVFMEAQKAYDSDALALGAWVRLSSEDKSANMKTVFSNKLPGCETSSGQHGFSVYVNGWTTSDQNLYVEWGSDTSGCQKLSSTPTRIEYDRWYHVALALGEHSIALYINGAKVAEKDHVSRGQQQQNMLHIGQHPEGQYPFIGNISHIVVLKTSDMPSIETIQLVLDVRNVDSIPSSDPNLALWAHFTLHDASFEVPGTSAINAVGSSHGKYHFPPPRSEVVGLTGLVDGLGTRTVTEEMIKESDELGRIRRQKIKAAMKHAWSGYEKYAWGRDELKPLSRRGHDNWGGMGVTLVDSLDTLWLMDMKEEFWRGRDWVANSLNFDRAGTVSTFETTIRELGGLLAAYDLSNDKIFVVKAKQLGERLFAAFNTPSGIAKGQVNLNSGNSNNAGWTGGSSVLAELGTLQVEFCYLAEVTGEKKYCEKAMKAFEILYEKKPEHGLYPIHIDPGNGNFNNRQVTFGALGDSFYEYMLKIWLQGGKSDSRWRDMYDRAMDGVANKLLQKSSPSGLSYVADWDGGHLNHKMDHLVCFLPGILALGAYTDPGGLDSARAQRDLGMAKALTYTCYQMYARQGTGIAPEYVNFVSGRDFQPGPGAAFYILRPETAESLFVLNQLTKDPIYRQWGWEIFEAIDKHCRTEIAYGSLPNVVRADGRIDDRMESFFLAETMKYLYLLQDPDHPIDLMKYVFNTEAHPLSVFKRS